MNQHSNIKAAIVKTQAALKADVSRAGEVG